MAVNKFYRGSEIVENRYFGIPKYTRENISFEDVPGKELQIQEGDRLDIIAEQLYGDANLWKAICLYNNLQDFFQLKPGDIIKVPFNINLILDRL